MTLKNSLVRFGSISTLALSSLLNTALAQPPVPTPADPASSGPELAVVEDAAEPQVLEDGPLHEAFARPLALEGQALIIEREPPEPINELPPDERPEGNNVHWIPGYWFFDQERNDFVWVSGLWRNFPPGRTWVPGDWQQVDGGFQWVPGFWADAGQQEERFLPPPPETLEQGPSSPAPGDNYLWAPGCWQWRAETYVWQPGFWYAAQPDWVWIPNHYCYTPQGSVYVNGYWDYPLARRGLLYAPTYWGVGYRWAPGYYYRPRVIVRNSLLLAHLFLDFNHGFYYFGSSWGYGRPVPRYLTPWNNTAFHNWGHYHGRSQLYDPLWAHFNWDGHHHGMHGIDSPRNLAQKTVKVHNRDHLVSNLEKLDLAERKQMHLKHVDSQELAKFRKQADVLRKFDRQGGQKGQQFAGGEGGRNQGFGKNKGSMRIPQLDQTKLSENTVKQNTRLSQQKLAEQKLSEQTVRKNIGLKSENRARVLNQGNGQFDAQAGADQRVRTQRGKTVEGAQVQQNPRFKNQQSTDVGQQMRERFKSQSANQSFRAANPNQSVVQQPQVGTQPQLQNQNRMRYMKVNPNTNGSVRSQLPTQQSPQIQMRSQQVPQTQFRRQQGTQGFNSSPGNFTPSQSRMSFPRSTQQNFQRNASPRVQSFGQNNPQTMNRMQQAAPQMRANAGNMGGGQGGASVGKFRGRGK